MMIRRDLIKFDLRVKEWSRVGCGGVAGPAMVGANGGALEMPAARFGHSAVVREDGRMQVFGGWDGHYTLNELLVFDLRRECWVQAGETTGEIPARYRHSAVTTPEAMYVFGGIDHTQ